MDEEIINKVAESGLVTLNLEEFFPKGERILFDLKNLLFEELILKEKDFRDFIKLHDWKLYQNKFVALHCSADAIVPTWAFMLVAVQLEPFAKKIVFGDLDDLEDSLFMEAVSKINPEAYRNQRIIIKGCSNSRVPESAFVEITRILRPVATSIFYGEPCSTVPLYKRR